MFGLNLKKNDFSKVSYLCVKPKSKHKIQNQFLIKATKHITQDNFEPVKINGKDTCLLKRKNTTNGKHKIN